VFVQKAEQDEYEFPCDSKSPGMARKAVLGTIGAWGLARETGETAELLVSELVTNAVIHAHGSETCRLVCEMTGSGLRVTVFDQGTGVPVRRVSPAGATNGRGLFLVEALADAWGVEWLRGGGKGTFFVLRAPLPPAPAEPGDAPTGAAPLPGTRTNDTAEDPDDRPAPYDPGPARPARTG
jgi:anti-sigma regulatory factor (Ser/Thr protein kinase)